MNKKDIIVKSNKYKINPIIHSWIDDVDLVLDAVEDFGYGGVVTNVSGKDGFTSNPDNVKRLSVVTENCASEGSNTGSTTKWDILRDKPTVSRSTDTPS